MLLFLFVLDLFIEFFIVFLDLHIILDDLLVLVDETFEYYFAIVKVLRDAILSDPL